MIIANEDTRRIRVLVGDENIYFVCRHPTARELADFLKARWKAGRRGKVDDRSNEERLKFVDKVLLNVENVHYRDESGKIRPLNSNVPEWKKYLRPEWKISAAQVFEERDAEDAEGDASEETGDNAEASLGNA